MSVEIQRMMVGITTHVTRKTADCLDKGEYYARAGEYGWCFPVIEDQDVPDDLRRIYDRARQENCSFVMLDRDGDEISGLPSYDW